MYRIYQLKMQLDSDLNDLRKKAASFLGIKTEDIKDLKIFRKSIDARDKNDVFYVYAVDVETDAKPKNRFKPNEAGIVKPFSYKLPECGDLTLKTRPVIVGLGPAGLFGAYILAKAGYKPIVLERGKSVDERQADVDEFLKTNALNPDSNVLFGEGGAGTFSDGKLNTLIKDKDGKGRFVLSTFIKHGAQEDILYDAKPHIGTDRLKLVVKSMREEIVALGGEIRFLSRLSTFKTENDGNSTRITEVMVEKLDNDGNVVETYTIPTEICILATGHSARDVFEDLHKKKVNMEPKPFAIGVRAIHPQKTINISQYGRFADKLPAAPYKLTNQCSTGRSVYSFCMCPGGFVINSSSENGGVVVNGMSYSKRDGEYANSAIICNVTPEDFANEGFGDDALSGVKFQRKYEAAAYALANGKVPVESLGSFSGRLLKDCESSAYSDLDKKVMGECVKADLKKCLPDYVSESLVEAFSAFERKIKGFNADDTLLCGIESRTSSPVKILRDKEFNSSVVGLMPCGEGPGYAGGIMSAALDGIKVAEQVIRTYKKP